jgi:hypothetical protein
MMNLLKLAKKCLQHFVVVVVVAAFFVVVRHNKRGVRFEKISQTKKQFFLYK